MTMVILLVAIFLIMCLGFAAILSKFDIISDYLDDITEGDSINANTSEHFFYRHEDNDEKNSVQKC